MTRNDNIFTWWLTILYFSVRLAKVLEYRIANNKEITLKMSHMWKLFDLLRFHDRPALRVKIIDLFSEVFLKIQTYNIYKATLL